MSSTIVFLRISNSFSMFFNGLLENLILIHRLQKQLRTMWKNNLILIEVDRPHGLAVFFSQSPSSSCAVYLYIYIYIES